MTISQLRNFRKNLQKLTQTTNPLPMPCLFCLLRASCALTTRTDGWATSRSCVPLASISEVNPDNEPNASLESLFCFAPLPLFLVRPCGCRISPGVCAGCVVSPRHLSGDGARLRRFPTLTTMTTKTRLQNRSGKKGRLDTNSAARCADL